MGKCNGQRSEGPDRGYDDHCDQVQRDAGFQEIAESIISRTVDVSVGLVLDGCRETGQCNDQQNKNNEDSSSHPNGIILHLIRIDLTKFGLSGPVLRRHQNKLSPS